MQVVYRRESIGVDMMAVEDTAERYISIAAAIADMDEQKAYIANARLYLDELRHTIHDILTGENDKWAKRQLLALVDAADNCVKRAVE